MVLAQAEDQFLLANEAYEAGQYEASIPAFENLIEQGFRSPALYYNLGNAYMKDDQLARAILNYERGLLIDRDDVDIQYNLSIAREKAEDEIQPLPPFFLITWWQLIRDHFSSTIWAIVSIAFLWFAVGGISLWMLAANRNLKKTGFLTGIVAGSFSLIILLLAAQRSVSEIRSNYAIVVQEVIDLKIASSSDSKTVLTMHEGSKVELVDFLGTDCNSEVSKDCWYKVQLANGEEGWLPTTSLERI